MRRKWLLIGNDGVGKTTLASLIEKRDLSFKKSLDLQYRDKTIEVSEGYIENSYLNNALIMVGQNQALVNVFMIGDGKDIHIPPGFAKSFTKETITIINKIDLYDEDKLCDLKDKAREIGSGKIFEVSFKTGQGLDKLKEYIKKVEERYAFYNRR